MTVIRDPKTFCFNFDKPSNVDQNLKHEIEFITKSNEALAENKTKNETNNYIHEHGKQQKKLTI